jgi:hypothetical protein
MIFSNSKAFVKSTSLPESFKLKLFSWQIDIALDRLETPLLRQLPARKVDIRLPGKGNSDSHGARPVY